MRTDFDPEKDHSPLLAEIVPLIYGPIFDPDKISGAVRYRRADDAEMLGFCDADAQVVLVVGNDHNGYWVQLKDEDDVSMESLQAVVEYLKTAATGVLRHLV